MFKSSRKIFARPNINLKHLVENQELYKQNVTKRRMNNVIDIDNLAKLYTIYNKQYEQIKEMKNQRKLFTIDVTSKDDPRIEKAKLLKEEILKMEEELVSMAEELDKEKVKVPNLSHESVPDEENVLFQTPNIDMDKKVLNHLEICQRLDLCDFDSGSEISGPKSYYLKNDGVFLEYALAQFVLNHLRKKGFTVLTTPELVKKNVVEGCGFQPRGNHTQIYSIQDSDLCLIGTSEIPLAGYLMDKIKDVREFPMKFCGISHCFRTEAGASGLKEKGLYRVHQFTKVELFIYSNPKNSDEEFEKIVEIQREIYDLLEIPYRVLSMPHHELGGSASRKIDIEAWMPGKKAFGEISSTSNCTDYQSRRLNIKYREGSMAHYVHTLNGTAIAIPRIMIPILENGQYIENSKLKIKIPKILNMSDLSE